MAEIEIHRRGRCIERFDSDVDPADELDCVTLLRHRARELRRPVEELTLRTWLKPGRRQRVEYRA